MDNTQREAKPMPEVTRSFVGVRLDAPNMTTAYAWVLPRRAGRNGVHPGHHVRGDTVACGLENALTPRRATGA